MSYIIGEKCATACNTECVTVCPANCIHGPIHNDMNSGELQYLRDTGELRALKNPQLYINPTECTNCGLCEQACPVDAVYSSEEIAIQNGDTKSVSKNYSFFGQTFTK
jgi:ferredoxin